LLLAAVLAAVALALVIKAAVVQVDLEQLRHFLLVHPSL
jgi:hypothetical protein